MGSETQTGRQDTAVPAIELRGISKAFGPVQANKDISMTVARGAILRCDTCGHPARLTHGDEIILERIEMEAPDV